MPHAGEYVQRPAGNVASLLATKEIGYSKGGGGTVTQITSKSTSVSFDAPTLEITMHNASLAAGASVAFTVDNRSIAGPSTLILHLKSGGTAGAYEVWVDSVAAASAVIYVRNRTAGALAEAIKLRLTVIKTENP